MTDPKQDVRQQFEAWHDKGWPEPKDSAPYHWKVEWHAARDARWEVYQAALQSTAVRVVEAAKGYVGPMDDPGIGWCGSSSSHPGLFKCERCGQEHTDCSLIPHRPDCSAARLLAALRTLGAGHE